MMYQRLSTGETIEIEWKSSGRRKPTQTPVTDTEVKKNANAKL